MKKELLLLFLSIIFYNIGNSQTEVSGNIASDTKWSKINSPYTITDNLTIFGGVTLEIEAGVVVNSIAEKSIKVYGNLLCSGTKSDSIFINSCFINAEYDTRQSIIMNFCVVSNSNGFLNNDYCVNTIFRNCRFYNNNTVIYNSIPYNQMYIDSCLFSNNGTCVQYAGTSITNSIFKNNRIGIDYANHDDVIKNCEFSNNSDVAIRIDAGIIENNVISGNGIGINTLSSKTTIKNNIITNNTIGILNNAVNLDFTGNDIYQNRDLNFKHTYPGVIAVPNNCWDSNNIEMINSTNSPGVYIVPINTDCTSSTDIKNSTNGLDLFIYPSIATNQIHIVSNAPKNYNWDIYNCLGEKIMSLELTSNNKVVDISTLDNGIYFIINKDYRKVAKFIKAK